MTELDRDETELLGAYERRELTSVATKEELARIREAARATGVKDRRIDGSGLRVEADDDRTRGPRRGA